MAKLQILPSMKLPKVAGSHWGTFGIIVIGALLGISLVMQGPIFTLGVILAFVLLFLIYQFPEFIILGILLLSSGILSIGWNPYFDLGIGHFQLSDLILIVTLVFIMVRYLAEHDFNILNTPLDFPLILFCVLVFVGIGNAVINHNILFRYTTYEARIMLYYLIFFVVTNLIRTQRQINRLLIGIFSLGFIAAFIIIFTVANRSTSFSSGIYYPDLLIRSFHPGFFGVMMTLLFLLCFLGIKNKPLPILRILLGLLILISSMLLSLGRNIFVSTLLSVLLLIFILRTHQRIQLVNTLMIFFVIVILAFTLANVVFPNFSILAYPQALYDRFVHLFSTDPMSPDETLLWRINETSYAWKQIAENPIWGIGIGTVYRPTFYEGDSLQTYIHNGYLWLWLKTGFLGLITFLGFIGLFLFRGFRLWTEVRNPFYQAAALGFTLTIFSMTISNIASPFFMQDFNLVFLAVAMGITEVIFAQNRIENINHSSRSMEGSQ